jgi:hypothetical protein
MTNCFLTHTDFEYTRMLAVGFVIGSCSGDGSPTIFEGLAGKILADKLQSLEGSRYLVVNCNGISLIDEHALSYFHQIVKDGKKVIFFFDSSHGTLEAEINKQISGPHATYFAINSSDVAVAFGFDAGGSELIQSILDETRKLEAKHLKDIVKSSWKPFEGGQERLSSTPLRTNGVFNARSIISDPAKLLWVGIFIAERVLQVIQESRIVSHCLLAVSLRGSPLASTAWFLTSKLGTRLEIVDHIGPIHEILEEPTFANERGSGSYIYIGDFIVGGTELKVAKTYAWSKGKRLEHAVVLGSVLNPEDYDTSGRLQIYPLVKLRDCDITLKYEFL